MTSLRAPNSLTRLPSQTELPRLYGLFDSSRSIFSPSLTAQIARAFCAAALAFRKKNARQMVIIRFKLFSSNKGAPDQRRERWRASLECKARSLPLAVLILANRKGKARKFRNCIYIFFHFSLYSRRNLKKSKN